ncbi:MAG: hypothetical protein HY290_00405 [Planctomycetia bacterium]|nr:hypothetical protein [Planctomycetia bacterium]
MDATEAAWTNDATHDAFDYASYPNNSAKRTQIREKIKYWARVGKRGQFTRTGEKRPSDGLSRSAADISASMTGAVANFLRDNLIITSKDVRSGSFGAYLVIAAVGRIDWPQLADRLLCKYMPDEIVPAS